MRWFEALIPAYTIERLFWESRGITIQEVVYTEIVYAVIVVFLEVPTGVLADRWERRRLLQIGIALEWLSFIVLLLSFSLIGFVLAISLSAIGAVLRSGSENALLYETLEQDGDTDAFERLLGRLNAIGLVAAVIAAFSGSLLATKFPFEFNYMLSLVSLFIATMCSLLLVEPRRVVHEEAVTWRQLKAGFRFIWNDKSLLMLTGSFVLVVSAFNFVDEFWQLYARDVNVPIYWFGAVSTVLLLIQIPGQLLAPVLLKVAPVARWQQLIAWGIGIGFILLGTFPNQFGLLWMALMALLVGAVEPLYFGVLHRALPSMIRATTESTVSMLLHGGIIGLGVLFIGGAGLSLFTAFFVIGSFVCACQAVLSRGVVSRSG
ncbi:MULTISPECIES: MFS transporter [unclassified Exiguobacterium]|uniref:MFS transporter n=1 Tax=unclassified Exiguobacterium TaxID=2644629 RepID=UPI0010394C8D|nr:MULTISPECIES: MFS transporter [unclassified Exiguobacterium]TCI34572.1 MFS transporter [Exiguobacterium sp. SH4S7]TCI60645.1 MFS transporter [Exiguobacterium sp. SH0S2]TCI77106.1 MFS transporter [Exiguobacterium sp. SH0S1]